MTTRRFYIPPDKFGETIRLGSDEARHLSKVLRLGEGDKIAIFDGLGRECMFRIDQINPSDVLVTYLKETESPAPESHLRLTLAVPLLKKSNTEIVLQKAVELGVTHFVPLVSKRTEISSDRWKPERANRITYEAAKQCGRATLPTIAEPIAFEQFVKELNKFGILFYEGEGDRMPSVLESNELVAITGPEGGWDKSEIELARAEDIRIIHLGGRILRAETAAITATAILQNKYGDLNETVNNSV